MAITGTKHLIQCHCVLPQYRGRKTPVFHKFAVFSVIDNEGDVIPKFAQCNSCDAIHKVIDICKSEIIHGVDESDAILTVSDIKHCIPDNISKIIETHNCSFATWEHIKFVIDNSLWGEQIVISRETIGDSSQVKILKLNSKDNYKIETQLRQEEITGKYLI
jgi:hypothetical protein